MNDREPAQSESASSAHAAPADARTPVTVIVVNYNGRAFLESCIESIYAQNPDEVLLIDSGSTDGAENDAVSRFGERGLRLIRLDGNLGPSVARNRGMQEARNDRVLLIDNDVELLEGCLAALEAALDSDDRLALVQARSVIDVAPEDGGRLLHYDGADHHYLGFLSLHNFYAPFAGNEATGVRRVGCAVSLCCLARKHAMLEVGGYDEPMFYLMEDCALAYALRISGYDIAVAEEAVCLHKGGTQGLSLRGESRKLPVQRSRLQSRNRWMFLLTHYRVWTLVLISPALFVYGVVHLAFMVASGHTTAWIRGKLDLIGMAPYMWRRRRLLQGNRRIGDRDLLLAADLTFNKGLSEGGVRGLVRRGLDGFSRLWFALVRRAIL